MERTGNLYTAGKSFGLLLILLMSGFLLIGSGLSLEFGSSGPDAGHSDHHGAGEHEGLIDGQSVTAAPGDTVDIRSFGADLSYDVTQINVKAGEEITIRYINSSDMPHNIIMVNEQGDINPVGIAALQSAENDYVPQNEMDRIFAYTELARPGETVLITFTAPPPGTYPYICTYPGHFTLMQGRLISEE